MAIFNSYVSLPEGTTENNGCIQLLPRTQTKMGP